MIIAQHIEFQDNFLKPALPLSCPLCAINKHFTVCKVAPIYGAAIWRLLMTRDRYLQRSRKFNNSAALIALLKPGFSSSDIHLSQLSERREKGTGHNPGGLSVRSRAMSLEESRKQLTKIDTGLGCHLVSLRWRECEDPARIFPATFSNIPCNAHEKSHF